MAGRGVEIDVKTDCEQTIQAGPFSVRSRPAKQGGGVTLSIAVEAPITQVLITPCGTIIPGRLYRLPELYQRSLN